MTPAMKRKKNKPKKITITLIKTRKIIKKGSTKGTPVKVPSKNPIINTVIIHRVSTIKKLINSSFNFFDVANSGGITPKNKFVVRRATTTVERSPRAPFNEGKISNMIGK